MGRMVYREPIWELQQPFQTRQEVEEKLKEILDLIEEGNWIRARYDERIFHRKLENKINAIMKSKMKNGRLEP